MVSEKLRVYEYKIYHSDLLLTITLIAYSTD